MPQKIVTILNIDGRRLYRQRLLLCYLTNFAPKKFVDDLNGLQHLLDEIADTYYDATHDETVYLRGGKKEDKRGKKWIGQLMHGIYQTLLGIKNEH